MAACIFGNLNLREENVSRKTFKCLVDFETLLVALGTALLEDLWALRPGCSRLKNKFEDKEGRQFFGEFNCNLWSTICREVRILQKILSSQDRRNLDMLL